jgi:hypothetical protein
MNETFSVGDMVTYTGKLVGKSLQCKVIKVMPVEHAHAIRSYRIRNSAEAFDRAVPEFTLTRIEPTASDLIFKS